MPLSLPSSACVRHLGLKRRLVSNAALIANVVAGPKLAVLCGLHKGQKKAHSVEKLHLILERLADSISLLIRGIANDVGTETGSTKRSIL